MVISLKLKSIRPIETVLTEISTNFKNVHEIVNISVNMARICLIFYSSTHITLRNHPEYFYNFSYFIYNGKKLCILRLPAVFLNFENDFKHLLYGLRGVEVALNDIS